MRLKLRLSVALIKDIFYLLIYSCFISRNNNSQGSKNSEYSSNPGFKNVGPYTIRLLVISQFMQREIVNHPLNTVTNTKNIFETFCNIPFCILSL